MSVCPCHAEFQYILQVFISCQYWLINNTGLPLIFKQDGATQEAAGQFEENELARNLQPLLFSYTEPELPEKCVLDFYNTIAT